MILFSQLAIITKGKVIQLRADIEVLQLITDSRKILVSPTAIFFAITGQRYDGHRFLTDLYKAGVRQFVVDQPINVGDYPEANILQVKSSLLALQEIVKHHRSKFHIPVIGVAGSNGKTIVKEWLYQLLSPDYRTVKNPGSYNSQLGVPLSVWLMHDQHELGIFEAGISKPGEMSALQAIIQPTIGIFTNLGSAHDEGFSSQEEKLNEKLKLFESVDTLIYCSDHKLVDQIINHKKIPSFSWGTSGNPHLKLVRHGKKLNFHSSDSSITVLSPFEESASLENLCHCIALMIYFGKTQEVIQQRINLLKSVPMRMELKDGIYHSQVIDDTYNNDLAGLKISLDFLASQQRKKKSIVLSDIFQSGLEDDKLTKRLQELIGQVHPARLMGVGPFFHRHQNDFKEVANEVLGFESTEDFLKHTNWNSFQDEVILVKGARVFQFEKIVEHLQRKVHGTVMEIDLNKLVHNLNFFKSRLLPNVKIMVMVKAFAYGSGSEEVANLLQYHKVDYLGVAYADEGIELRKNQIQVPIMVMNTSSGNFDSIFSHRLEPVIFNLRLLHSLIDYLAGREAIIHIELETGMQRLGFEGEELDEVIDLLKANANVKVASIYSHLAGADEKQHDDFSMEQIHRFEMGYKKITTALAIQPLRHILNSSGILRLPQFQMDMVRLGVGLYGVNPTQESWIQLQPAATLKTVISQIKKIRKGESIGYGRQGKADQELTIATIAIGYADGFSRAFSRGKGKVLVNGKLAPVIGNVCMDMTMINISGIEAAEGDEVIIFGEALPIQQVAESINTIPYEILTSTSERVKRVFFAESI